MGGSQNINFDGYSSQSNRYMNMTDSELTGENDANNKAVAEGGPK